MSRIRTIKPELFMDEELGVLSGDHALLFIGLWTLADREGRFEWRPSRVKAFLFPFRRVEVDPMLADLERIGKIAHYEIDGVQYGYIPGFARHQRPHPKEQESKIPPPSVELHGKPGKGVSLPVGKGREGKEIFDNGKGREGGALAPAPSPLFLALEAKRLAAHPGTSDGGTTKNQTAKLTAAVSEHGEGAVVAAFSAFLADPFWEEKAHPIGAFVGQLSSYLGRKTPKPEPKCKKLSDEELASLYGNDDEPEALV